MQQGKITISHPTPADYITIVIVDESSSTSFVEIHVPYLEFLHALFGSARQDCEFRLNQIERVGKTREHKTVEIDITSVKGYEDNAIEKYRELLKVYEVDGWKGSIADIKNPHRHVHTSDQTFAHVLFVRFV